MAHIGSATGSDHSLDAPVVCKVSSNGHDHVDQIKGSEVRNQVVSGLSWDSLGALRCVASFYATKTAVQSIAVLQPPMPPERTVNGQKICVLSLVAKAKQGGVVQVV
eukprot:6214130-Pleurochrysis_carterae.AAC.1